MTATRLPVSERLRFREMTPDDLDVMAALLGDARVMAYYPRPKTRGEAAAWIDLVAIIHPENTASRRVAEKIGLRFEKTVGAGAYARSVFGANI